MTSTYKPKLEPKDASIEQRAAAERERRRRQREHIPESEKCAASFIYFVVNYVKIYDATEKRWIPFKLWKEQQEIAEALTFEKLVIILKARQLGMTWLVLAYALWLMLFYPAATILLFSLRDTESVYLLSKERLRGMFERLPSWLMMRKWHIDQNGAEVYEWIPRDVIVDGGHLWQLSNDSSARAFPTSAGDSYTATLAIVDEADLVPDLAALLLRVKPTIDGGGQLVLLSKVNKSLPKSEFKAIYRGAKDKINSYISFFLPWWVRPDRDPAWYQRQMKDAEASTEGTDSLFENYPATDDEALAPKQIDKRLPYKLLKPVYAPDAALETEVVIPGLRMYLPVRIGKQYVIGGDPAEGNLNSDPSAIQVVEKDTGAQAAALSGLFDVDIFVGYIKRLSRLYNGAAALIERNNHGHAVLYGLRNDDDMHNRVALIEGEDGKPGWQSNKRTKVILYDDMASTAYTEDCLIFDRSTFEELSSIEGSTLLAPSGMHDDEADAFCLAQVGRRLATSKTFAPAAAGKRDTSRMVDRINGLPGRYDENVIGARTPMVATKPIVGMSRNTKTVKRIAIIGWPGTGKTTLGRKLAAETGLPYRSTDEAMHLKWGEDSAEVARWLDGGQWIIEGVSLARALRKWRDNHPGAPAPVDRIIYLKKTYRPLLPGAISMGKGIDTVLEGLRGWLPKIENR